MNLIACFSIPQFGIAVERARLTHLWGKPMALVGSDGRLMAVSDETQPFGIQIGQKQTGAQSLCQGLIVLHYDRPAYEDAARSTWDLFAIESSFVEPVSPELCYIEFSGSDIVARVEQLSEELAARLRIEVRTGIGRTKFIAFHAANSNRKSKMQNRKSNVVITMDDETNILSSVRIESIGGLDDKQKQWLHRMGVRTLADVTKLPARDLQRQLKEMGLLLQRFAKGDDGDLVRPLWPPRKIEERMAFEDEVVLKAQFLEAMRVCSEKLSQRIGREFARFMSLEVSLANGDSLVESEKQATPINSASALMQCSKRLLDRLHITRPITSLSLAVSDLAIASGVQLSLLDKNDRAAGLPHERESALNSTTSYIRRRFGPASAVAGEKLRANRRISLWTYPLGQLHDDPIHVITDQQGLPARFWRSGSSLEVCRIHDRWKEAEWIGSDFAEREVYRVETESHALWELHRHGDCWRLRGISD